MDKKGFEQAIRRENKTELQQAQSSSVLVALSGGADSVAMLRVLLALGCECRAAHCNFHLRGEESMRDESFVKILCQQLAVPLVVKDFDVNAHQREHGGSVEMACRELRYAWFEQERERQGCRLIAVAHHADDQVETFFLNLLRGTGIRGLTGMERLNGNIWRPLLGTSRADIFNYLERIGQDYVTDSTNDENSYRRNRLRNIIIPVIEQQFPQARERILATMDNLAHDHSILQALAAHAIPSTSHINTATLLKNDHAPTLLYHRIRHMGFNRSQCEQAVEAAQNGHSGRRFDTPTHIMHINRQSIDIEPSSIEPTLKPCNDIEIDLTDDLSQYGITVSTNNAPFSPLMCDGKRRVAFNKDVLQCQHIVLRHWKRGDRIKPFGMKGTKLVSDLFNDLKLDQADKRDIWLLEADGDILWVLGHRASALYPVTPESQEYLLLQI